MRGKQAVFGVPISVVERVAGAVLTHVVPLFCTLSYFQAATAACNRNQRQAPSVSTRVSLRQ